MDSAGTAASAGAGISVDRVQETSYCVECPVKASSFCATLQGRERSPPDEHDQPLVPEYELIHAREVFYHADRPVTQAYAICEGWAISFVRLRDGRRHIVHILIPGDFVAGVFRDSMRHSLQAVTDMRVGKYSRADIRARLMAQPTALNAWIENCLSLEQQVAQTAIALGKFTANERIAALVLRLRDRLAARGFVENESFAFPLRQTHIADATWLTTVHVSRVLGGLRKAGLLAIDDGTLTILDLPKLRRIADVA